MAARVASLVVGEESRAARRRRIRQENRLRRALAVAEREERARARRATRAMWDGEGHLPALGESGRRRGRQLREGRVVCERASTRTLRVAYPFVADEGTTPPGIVIGRDTIHHRMFAFDPFALYRARVLSNPNVAVAGVIGTGKSSLMKCLALRGAAFGYRTFVPGDVKGEWSPVVRAVGGSVVSVGGASGRRINPLDEGRRPDRDRSGGVVDDQAWARMVRSQRLRLIHALVASLMGHPLDADDKTAVASALDRVVGRTDVPVLPMVVEELLVPPSGADLPLGVRGVEELARLGRRAGRNLEELVTGALRGMLDGPSTVAFDPGAPMMSIDLRGFTEGDESLPLLMACTQTWMESALRGGDMGHRFVVYDEAHRLMRTAGLLPRMSDQWKLCRSWGISNILVLHRISDSDAAGPAGSTERAMAEGLVADTSTRVICRQEADQLARTTRRLGLNAVGAEAVANLQTGVALWMVGKRSYVVAHDRTPWEIGLTDTDEAMGAGDE